MNTNTIITAWDPYPFPKEDPCDFRWFKQYAVFAEFDDVEDDQEYLIQDHQVQMEIENFVTWTMISV